MLVVERKALVDLIHCIEKDYEVLSSGEDGLKSLEVIAALTYSSANNEEVVRLPFKDYNLKIPEAEGDIGLEKWSLEKKYKLFERLFDLKLKMNYGTLKKVL